jgi:hypothetical protein
MGDRAQVSAASVTSSAACQALVELVSPAVPVEVFAAATSAIADVRMPLTITPIAGNAHTERLTEVG